MLTALVLLSGCRVFLFLGPVATTGPPDPSPTTTSEAVTITNTQAHAYLVRVAILDCGPASSYGMSVYAKVGNVDFVTRLCDRGGGIGGPLPISGVLYGRGQPLVIQPGQTITLQANVTGFAATVNVPRAVPFDAFGVWCYDGCFDMVPFT